MKNRSIEMGIDSMTAQALPSAAILTASCPFPSRQSIWDGSTDSAVSGSGIPRKVLGMLSRNVWVINAENIVAVSASAPIIGRRIACIPSREAARVFE